MPKPELLREAVERQGTVVRCQGRSFRVDGTSDRAVFKMGGEGLVHLATDLSTNNSCRIKCFWEPSALRRKRSEMLVQQQLADLGKTIADALGGAPYEMLRDVGTHTPFAIVMKDVHGFSWKDLKENGLQRSLKENQYPPPNWPSLPVRATWAYGLATAVLNMERRRFIHADLSDGNVMVTPAGQAAGDMALVDFDAFIHPSYPHLDSTCKGSEGYAAPEIWRSQSVDVGSDRVGMAILIQEFLVVGDPNISRDEAFGWRYDEETEICSKSGEAHPFFAKKYPELAKLLVASLRAANPASRPTPDAWRQVLRTIATGGPVRNRLTGVTLDIHPVPKAHSRVTFSDSQKALDLSKTPYKIRATLERNGDGSIDAAVHPGATLHVQYPSGKLWKEHTNGARINVVPGTILFDPQGQANARIDAQEVKASSARTGG